MRLAIQLLILGATTALSATDNTLISQLRQDTRDLFYHGFDNYMSHAFPDDELKPISCGPQTRNRENPADIGVNDPLGNYSVTLIDSLSTLAILASGPPQHKKDKRDPFRDFQNGVKSLVELYGAGTDKKPCGTRACGFDLDSKVQVFETNIRGVGGLLSAHLFARGHLPINGYRPVWKTGRKPGIRWKNGFVYNDQLLHLAHDLASRLLPAFTTPTDIPYPRVNLRTGIPFYRDAEGGICRLDGTSTGSKDITENCAAGAGSLVLEFTTLSRLTGDARFENVAKKAFWAIWDRRSGSGLLGNGVDAESGLWTHPPLSGIGAGIDSFFEYSIKSHILLSNLPYNVSDHLGNSPASFLTAWEQAHAAVKHHVYHNSKQEKHPYYGQVDWASGAPRYAWIDNLSAYYPGLLVLAGHLEEAIESHLLYSALWTRFGALPERYNVASNLIDQNFKHWVGRPEFIESTFYLYQATKDPYYLHVGEMTLRDIRKRCWTKCGWADLADVMTGEQRDRMESFFLGETAKYLYLLFTEDHPLNKLDKPFVFTTEGHPMIIPDRIRTAPQDTDALRQIRLWERQQVLPAATCPAPLPALPLTASNTANRDDLFHASAMALLHLTRQDPARSSPLTELSEESPGISFADVRSPTNYTFYPWTLPRTLIPAKGLSSPILSPVISTLTFPNLAGNTNEGAEKSLISLGALQKIVDGVLINSLSNLRLNMVQEPKSLLLPDNRGVLVEQPVSDEFRIHGIANWALGRDEKVLLSGEALKGVSPTDPHFTRVKDLEMIDLVLDVPILAEGNQIGGLGDFELEGIENATMDSLMEELQDMISSLFSASTNTAQPARTPAVDANGNPTLLRQYLPAILSTGPGAAPPPAGMDIDPLSVASGQLPHDKIFFLDDELCDHRLPASIAKTNQILILRRGSCSFNDKLANIPAFAPHPDSLQLVIVISGPEEAGSQEGTLIRPLLDQIQLTPTGIERRHPIAMCMVNGAAKAVGNTASSLSYDTEELLKRVASASGRFVDGKLAEARRTGAGDGKNKVHLGTGLGVKRRYWFESMGVVINNLLMV
ncbi:hypothetical protein AC579_10313 [Pseudocercospora musae]|uniref:alpha-1,2-Mannosidase n=1 Tax=Pseudocercospora musae TaxID=113226 RepID=A0A139I2L6_9PEZI|nr:hypothetical protein AC579_10313 [Pseudocercospora musae]